MIPDVEVSLPRFTPEEERQAEIELRLAMLNSPRARHAFAEGFEDVPLWGVR